MLFGLLNALSTTPDSNRASPVREGRGWLRWLRLGLVKSEGWDSQLSRQARVLVDKNLLASLAHGQILTFNTYLHVCFVRNSYLVSLSFGKPVFPDLAFVGSLTPCCMSNSRNTNVPCHLNE